jgi:hypothetical protein
MSRTLLLQRLGAELAATKRVCQELVSEHQQSQYKEQVRWCFVQSWQMHPQCFMVAMGGIQVLIVRLCDLVLSVWCCTLTEATEITADRMVAMES